MKFINYIFFGYQFDVRILLVRHNNESYVVPDLKGVTLQQHYDAIKAMVK